jgi:hypothetical protein
MFVTDENELSPVKAASLAAKNKGRQRISAICSGKAPWDSSLEEFQNLLNKLFVILEYAAVPGVPIENEFGFR